MDPAGRILAAILPLLAALLATPALARGEGEPESAAAGETVQADQDIYAAHRAMFRQAGPAISAEGFTTALVKKHMAMLMYPVDLGVFKHPDQDDKFRSQIRLFQERLGVPATGTLTLDQFQRLQDAAVTAGERRVLPPGSLVVRREGDAGSEVARALGSWLGIERELPLNYAEIVCRQTDQACLETSLRITVPRPSEEEADYRLALGSRSYRVLSWGEEEVVAEAQVACGPLRLAINTRSGQAARHSGGECASGGDEAASAQLSSGTREAGRFFGSRRAGALKLSHDPFRP